MATLLTLSAPGANSKKMKVIESAREAVARGSAGEAEFGITASGAYITKDGRVVPSSI